MIEQLQLSRRKRDNVGGRRGADVERGDQLCLQKPAQRIYENGGGIVLMGRVDEAMVGYFSVESWGSYV
eukprot:461208-Hanusia_phi.AAC.3